MDPALLSDLLSTLDYVPAPEDPTIVFEWLESRKRRFGHFIGGRRLAAGGEVRPVHDPSTGALLAHVAEGSSREVDRAVRSAEAAFPDWMGLSGFERAKYLYAIARAIAKHARLFALLESMNSGKTIRESRDFDIPLVIRHFYHHAGWSLARKREYPQRAPGGVVAAVIPWNFPLLMLAWKVAPAIAVGNTIVLKPAETTPLTALLFAEILEKEAVLPPGVVNIVTGGSKTGEALVTHPVPWKVAFTGSTDVGRRIRSLTAGTGKHLTLELGGKSPFIVFANADLDSAVEGVVDAIWFNQGQVCSAGSRLLLEESIAESFLERLKRRMERLRAGPPLDKGVDIGAINSEAQLRKISRYCAAGLKDGCEMWQPSSWRQPAEGFYHPPTLFTHVQPSHIVATEEIFGPVLACMRFRTPAEALRLANNTRYGLAASIWSQDISVALDVAHSVKAGTVWINSTNLFDAASGFGGYRESGYGREGGREGIEGFLFAPEHSKRKAGSTKIPLLQLSEILIRRASIEIDRTPRFLIGGKLMRPEEQKSIQIRSHKGDLLGIAGCANRKDLRNAVEAARGAQSGWSGRSAHHRAQIVYFLAENLQLHKQRLVDTIALEKNCSLKRAAKELDATLASLFITAAYADKHEGMVHAVPGRVMVAAIHEPIGVLGIVADNDYPLLGMALPMAVAIAMGNTVALVLGKHPLTGLDFVQILQSSDIPAGVVNILSARDPDQSGAILSEHEDVDGIWHFGSADGSIKAEKSSIGNMKKTLVGGAWGIDWEHPDTVTLLIDAATQVKNIWMPYGA